jgi:hypothetical protein
MTKLNLLLFRGSTLILVTMFLLVGNFLEINESDGLWYGLLWVISLNILVFMSNVKLFKSFGKSTPHSSPATGILWSIDILLSVFCFISIIVLIYFLVSDIDGYIYSFKFWGLQLGLAGILTVCSALIFLSAKLASVGTKAKISRKVLVRNAMQIEAAFTRAMGNENPSLNELVKILRYHLPHPQTLDTKAFEVFSSDLTMIVDSIPFNSCDQDKITENIENLLNQALQLLKS